MFSRKKEVDISSWADRQRRELHNNILTYTNCLQKRVEDVIIKNGVIALYPDGTDKEKAIRDLEEAKRKMLCGIGFLDWSYDEYETFCKKHADEFITTNDWKISFESGASHKLIESAYKNFYNP